MDLQLTFANGLLHGDGNDDVGPFLIKGKYDPATCECYWTKSYLGAHDVCYRGFREGKGIWGTWEISLFAHGGFHIWPKLASEGATETLSQEEPADAVSQESLPVSVPGGDGFPHPVNCEWLSNASPIRPESGSTRRLFKAWICLPSWP